VFQAVVCIVCGAVCDSVFLLTISTKL